MGRWLTSAVVVLLVIFAANQFATEWKHSDPPPTPLDRRSTFHIYYVAAKLGIGPPQPASAVLRHARKQGSGLRPHRTGYRVEPGSPPEWAWRYFTLQRSTNRCNITGGRWVDCPTSWRSWFGAFSPTCSFFWPYGLFETVPSA